MSTHEKEENPLRQQKPPCHEMRMKLVIYELRDFFGDEVGQHLRGFFDVHLSPTYHFAKKQVNLNS